MSSSKTNGDTYSNNTDRLSMPELENQVSYSQNMTVFPPEMMGFQQSYKGNCSGPAPNLNQNLLFPRLQCNRDPNNMTIQIGFQCMNQNQPMNFNSSEFPLNVQKTLSDTDVRPNGENLMPSLLNISYPTIESSSSDGRKMNGLINGIDSAAFINSVNQDSLKEITFVALQGCDIAEFITNLHRNRRCFKKIDSLCARLRQDISRPNNIALNIKSQGLVWAIKDLVFVFTRIMGAWTILKEYVYAQMEGLDKLKSSLSPDFSQRVLSWQNETAKLCVDIIRSVINLNDVVQTQNSCQRSNSCTKVMSNFPNGIPKMPSVSNLSENSNCGLSQSDNCGRVTCSCYGMHYQKGDGVYFRTGVYVPEKSGVNFDEKSFNGMVNCQGLYNNYKGEGDTKQSPAEPLHTGYNGFVEHLAAKEVNSNFKTQIDLLVERISNLSEGNFFLKSEFTKNYFPDFTTKHPNFLDFQSIIRKAENGGYTDLYQVVHDLRRIIHLSKKYLLVNQNNILRDAVADYEKEINRILKGNGFENLNFDHISGDPNENIYAQQKLNSVNGVTQ